MSAESVAPGFTRLRFGERSQTWSVLSRPPQPASRRPSGENATVQLAPAWPFRTIAGRRAATSQRSMSPLYSPLARNRPSGENSEGVDGLLPHKEALGEGSADEAASKRPEPVGGAGGDRLAVGAAIANAATFI